MALKRASGASEVFSLVMKSKNCLGIHVFTRNACLHLAYVSPLGECVLNKRKKKYCGYHHVFKSVESLDGDRGMDRCNYAVPFKGILIRSTPEIVLSSKTTRKRR